MRWVCAFLGEGLNDDRLMLHHYCLLYSSESRVLIFVMRCTCRWRLEIMFPVAKVVLLLSS
jgi:hypothetical protein